MASNLQFQQTPSQLQFYYGVLDITKTGSGYSENYNLIHDCFVLDTIFLYPGLKATEIFFKIDIKELDDLRIKIQQLAPNIEFLEINQKIRTFYITGFNDNSDLFAKRIEHISGASLDDRRQNILCCDYQKHLITKYAQTKWFNEQNLYEMKSSNDAITKQVNTIKTSDLLSDDEDTDYNKYMQNKNRTASNSNTNRFTYPEIPINIDINNDDDNSKHMRFNFRFKNFIELELTNDDLTELNNVDAIVNLTKYDLSFSVFDDLSKKLKEKCGVQYENEIEQLRTENFRSYGTRCESGTVLHTSSGDLRNFRYVLHAVVPVGWSLYDDEQKYNELFFIYLNILNYADKSLNLRTIALQLVDNFLNNDEKFFKINSLAFIHAMKQFCGDDFDGVGDQVCSLKRIFIGKAASINQNQLIILKKYLTSGNYLDLNLLDELSNTSSNIGSFNESARYRSELTISHTRPKQNSLNLKIDTINENDNIAANLRNSITNSSINHNQALKVTTIPPKKCSSCGTHITKFILDELYKSSCRVVDCEICKILMNLMSISSRIVKESNDLDETPILCINCAIETVINNFQTNSICACCYRSDITKANNLNKICNLHSICEKCCKTVQYGGIECKFCLFNKFNVCLDKLVRNNLFEKHDKINCSYDFCNLKNMSISDDDSNSSGVGGGGARNENTPTLELKCGHSSCYSARVSKSTSTSVCSFCTFKKLFEILKEKNNLNVNFGGDDGASVATAAPVVVSNVNRQNSNNESNRNLVNDDLRLVDIKRGPQPEGGKMDTYIIGESLPGYESHKTIVIEYNFPDGVFLDPNRNKPITYQGKKKLAYLPDNAEGNRLCELLQKAFDFGHVFKITYSSSYDFYYLTLNDITHKSSKNDYPDDTYLDTLKQELASKGFY